MKRASSKAIFRRWNMKGLTRTTDRSRCCRRPRCWEPEPWHWAHFFWRKDARTQRKLHEMTWRSETRYGKSGPVTARLTGGQDRLACLHAADERADDERLLAGRRHFHVAGHER